MRNIKLEKENRSYGGETYSTVSAFHHKMEYDFGSEGIRLVSNNYTEWRPSREELATLLVGAPLVLEIMGDGWPPVVLRVGTIPIEPRPTAYKWRHRLNGDSWAVGLELPETVAVNRDVFEIIPLYE